VRARRKKSIFEVSKLRSLCVRCENTRSFPLPFNGANPNEIRNRGRVRMMEHRNLARKPRRGFSANTFPIAEGRAPLGIPLTTLRDVRAVLLRNILFLFLYSPFPYTCPSEKFSRIALSRRTSRCPSRVPPIRTRRGEMGVRGQEVSAFLCVSVKQTKREREREGE